MIYGRGVLLGGVASGGVGSERAFRLGVRVEVLEAIDEIGAVERIATNPDTHRLPQTLPPNMGWGRHQGGRAAWKRGRALTCNNRATALITSRVAGAWHATWYDAWHSTRRGIARGEAWREVCRVACHVTW